MFSATRFRGRKLEIAPTGPRGEFCTLCSINAREGHTVQPQKWLQTESQWFHPSHLPPQKSRRVFSSTWALIHRGTIPKAWTANCSNAHRQPRWPRSLHAVMEVNGPQLPTTRRTNLTHTVRGGATIRCHMMRHQERQSSSVLLEGRRVSLEPTRTGGHKGFLSFNWFL